MNDDFPDKTSEHKAQILVVDDEEMNRRVLCDVLAAQGYAVSEAVDGEAALQAVARQDCDVILLDVMMPKLDGFETCRRIKQSDTTAHIPILMVTVLSDRESRLKGIRAGANDFLTKPIDIDEVLLRVGNAVKQKQLHDQLQEHYKKLEELEGLRDNLTHMIVHDMRSPLMGISGYFELLERYVGSKLDAEEKTYVMGGLESCSRLVEMVNSLLDISKMEAGKMTLNLANSDVAILIEEAIKSLGSLLSDYAPVFFDKPEGRTLVNCDASLIRRVVANLVGNSVKFTPQNGRVNVVIGEDGSGVRVKVSDNGQGIPPEYHRKIFEKFGQVDGNNARKMYSTGLGLTFCKMAVEAHGGAIGVESKVGEGSTFWFTLPA